MAPIRRILVAEDTPANRRLIGHILHQRGYELELVEDGQTALERARRGEFDLVLMDLRMPGMGGLEAGAAIRAALAPAGKRVPIVVLSAGSAEDRRRCFAAGMDAYLSKPIDRRELIEVVERLMGSSGEPASGPSVESQSPRTSVAVDACGAGEVPAQVFRLDDAVAHCFGNRHLLEEMARYYLAEMPVLLDRLWAATLRGDVADVADTAHRLAGTVVYLGAPFALAAVMELERTARSGDHEATPRALGHLETELARLRCALEQSSRTCDS